ncbi:MspA family porin [Nocardia seriolae]|nr:MspA family porin [Nocardia seriolae]WKY55125.1 MspA family porin [Nocardia seriolae]
MLHTNIFGAEIQADVITDPLVCPEWRASHPSGAAHGPRASLTTRQEFAESCLNVEGIPLVMMRPTITAGAGLLAAALMAGVWVAGSAGADAVADKYRQTVTDDGWTLAVTKTSENLDRWPNLASSPVSREGFVSLKAIAEVTGGGGQPITSGTVTLGYQIGCAVDVSNGLTLGLGFSIGPNASVTISQFPGATIGGQASVNPNISTTLKPGAIATIAFGSKPLAGPRASITAEQVEIKVDACAGPVTIRSFATAAISTPASDNNLSVYGDPIWL